MAIDLESPASTKTKRSEATGVPPVVRVAKFAVMSGAVPPEDATPRLPVTPVTFAVVLANGRGVEKVNAPAKTPAVTLAAGKF